MIRNSNSSPLTQREMEKMALISKEKARRDRGRKLGRKMDSEAEKRGSTSHEKAGGGGGGMGRTGGNSGAEGTPSSGIVYSRPFHYQKRSTPGPRPTPTRLFKRTQSEQQFGRPIFQALPMPAQQRSSLPLKTAAGGEGSPTLRKRSPSVADLGAQMKDVAQSVKNAAEEELRYELIRFAARTTAHGIPMAAQATKWYGKWMWICISLTSCAIFIWSVFGVFEKFQKKEKIVSVQLRFDNVPFPAITVCNLNPFKREEARRVHEISETLDAYHQAVTYSKHADQYYDETPASREKRNIRGGYRYVQIEPVMSDCECLEGFSGEGRHDCAQLDSIPKDNISLCICNYDRQDSTIWPCYAKASWYEDWCPNCNDIGYCTIPNTQNYSNTVPCICQKNLHYCLIRPERMKRMWEVRGTKIPDEDSPFRQDFLAQLKELGYENMTDEVAITTKTREKLVLTMASLHPEQRKALSYGRGEIIKMCSFNGQQCNIVNDFKLHADPAFGNCYTFNGNRVNPMMSSRPGPSYGLRLLIHVNTSEYLPTTQAAGVRIVIHSQDEYPFPDAFGYSAPTNQLSSFGIALRKVNRLPVPHGECLMPWELPEGYIYGNYKYEPEGCYKSCYQHQIIRKCGCGDPRFPTLGNTKVCNSTDLLDRNCLMVESIKFTRAQQCHCKHPCTHDVYTTAFSSARLTTEAFQGANFDAQSAAMLEIYYEQMSHEVLTESESYLLVNFISDVGGQAGLWLGASILTLFEVIVFLFRLLTIVCRRKIYDEDERRSFNLDEVINKKSADSFGPKRSNAMHKSASTLTSLSAKASLANAKVSSAKSDRNTSLPSLTDSNSKSVNNNNGETKNKKTNKSLRKRYASIVAIKFAKILELHSTKEKSKRSMGETNPANCASSEESFNEEDDESTPTPSKSGSRKESRRTIDEDTENGGFHFNDGSRTQNDYGFY